MHLAPNKRQWNYGLSSMIHEYPRHMVNIRLDCFLAGWRFTQMMIHHHTPLTSNHASFNIRKSRRSRMHLWCLFPFCSLPWLPFTAPSCVLSLLSTAQKRSKREAHSRRPCCGNVQPCMTDVMIITMYMSHKCSAKAQELRITKQKSPMERKL